MGRLYTAPREFVQSRVKFYATPSGTVYQPSTTFVVTLKSAVLIDIENLLNNVQNMCIEGRPQDPASYQTGWQKLRAMRLDTYPDCSPAADGPIDVFMDDAYDMFLEMIQSTPVDLSGRINAGFVADQLGKIPWANGSLDLSGFLPGPNA